MIYTREVREANSLTPQWTKRFVVVQPAKFGTGVR